MKKSVAFLLLCAVGAAGCDLQPKIMALPDSVGDFISERYPALLADPVTQADIYNSAATDYGVYASPELYGGDATTDDYVLYASVDDYIVPPTPTTDAQTVATPVADDAPADTDVTVVDWANAAAPAVSEPAAETSPAVAPAPDDFLNVPMYGGGEDIVIVARGDTLYAIAKKYDTTVDELARANNLTAPYALNVGQKLRIVRAPDTVAVPARPAAAPVAAPAPTPPAPTPPATTTPATTTPTPPSVPATPAPVQSRPGTATTTRVDVAEITVKPGDTLYSISRQYSVPVNDLAVMNNLAAPFALYAGQRVRVPNLASAKVKTPAATNTTPAATNTAPAVTKPTAPATQPAPTTTAKSSATPAKTAPAPKAATPTPAKTNTPKTTAPKDAKTTAPATTQKPKEKISSDPSKKLPTIAARSSSKFSWPVRGTILSNYGAKTNGLFNDGINISASRGTTVKAAENGVVAYAGNEVKGMGNLVIIQHADGWMTVYAHMDSMSVRRGAKVSVGQKIGTVGATGKVDKPQLHFEIRKGTKAYNPSQYLKK